METGRNTLKKAMAIQGAIQQNKKVDLDIAEIVRLCVHAGYTEIVERNNYETIFGEPGRTELRLMKEEQLTSELRQMDQPKREAMREMMEKTKREHELKAEIEKMNGELKGLWNPDLEGVGAAIMGASL